MKIEIIKNGPYKITGNIPLKLVELEYNDKNEPTGFKLIKLFETKETYCLCRCGDTKSFPFCDGSHTSSNFKGDEVANKQTNEEDLSYYRGKDFTLIDNQKLCAHVGFCTVGEGIWKMIKNEENNNCAKECISNCPTGRLSITKNNQQIEPNFEKEINIIYDPLHDSMCSLWVKGNIPIFSENGEAYEIKNRMTLCRCGKSKNMPFCDGSHVY